MIKRIGLLMVAALMAAMMMVATAVPAFADTQNYCENHPEDTNKCPEVIVSAPGGSLDSSGRNLEKNPKVERDQIRVVPTPH